MVGLLSFLTVGPACHGCRRARQPRAVDVGIAPKLTRYADFKARGIPLGSAGSRARVPSGAS